MKPAVFQLCDFPVLFGVDILHLKIREVDGNQIRHIRGAVPKEGVRAAGVELTAVMIHFLQILGAGILVLGVFAPDASILHDQPALGRIGKGDHGHH